MKWKGFSMSIFELKRAFSEGKLSKQEFINNMHNNHLIINDYAQYIKTTEIKKIIIENGKVFMISDDDIIFRCNFFDKANVPLINLSIGEYEKIEKKFLINSEADTKVLNDGEIIFDIGANYGFYSLNIANKYPNSKIYAFEPIKYTFDILCENISINNLNNIIPYNFGFGKENTVAIFNFNQDNSGSTSMINILERDDSEKIECPIYTLDSFVKKNNINKIDFIKCDVEGAEFFVFQGGKNILEKYIPIIFAEMLRKWSAKFGYHPNDIIMYMKNFGYSCFEFCNNKLKKFEIMTNDTISTNFLFLHNYKHSLLIKSLSQ